MLPERTVIPEEFDQEKWLSTLRILNNFCSSYNHSDTDALLKRLLSALIGGNYHQMNSFSKERLLNYFEAIEEVIPHLYELNSHFKSLTSIGDELTDENNVVYRRLFATLKRPPG